MMYTKANRERFDALCMRVLGRRLPYAELVNLYSGDGRHYHTLRHIDECLWWLDWARPACEDPDAIELALWYHDAIYDPMRRDNEGRSEQMFDDDVAAAGMDRLHGVSQMILATKKHASSVDGDMGIMLDIDLSILGATPDRFDEYESQVRKEYAMVPEGKFRRYRWKILSGFLRQPSIYKTALFRQSLESQAVENLMRSTRKLSDVSDSEAR